MAGTFSQTVITVLVLSTFCFHLSSALVCYTCTGCPDPFVSSSSSVTASNCSSSNTICVKNTLRTLNAASSINKGCVSTCTQSSSNIFGQGAFVDCCNTDYCNSSTRNQLSLPIYILFTIALGFILHYRQ